MAFQLPIYLEPDLTAPAPQSAPEAVVAPAPMDGVAPHDFHATSIFPEYFKVGGRWLLAAESRMDCVVVIEDGAPRVVEPRNLKKGEMVVLGRTEDGRDGIFMHADCFARSEEEADRFAFRGSRSRETAFSVDYDNLYELLKYEKQHGNILWVAGPAFSFDADSRNAMQALVEAGYVHGLMSGNALATHDLEGGLFKTALGQDIYTQKPVKNGHYHHLDVLNYARECGSSKAFVEKHGVKDGIMYSVIKNGIPFVLTGSIRDDGPLPEVYADVYAGANAMRELVRRATTIICLATQLHTIATGNMTPIFRVGEGRIRPLYFYSVDVSEFALNKLSDRGSLAAISMVTNVQDFVVHVARGLGALGPA